MEKIKITKLYTSDKDKQGNNLKSRDGKPYTRLSIKCEQYGDKWLSGFQNDRNKSWKEGDEVEIIVKQNGEYLNFDTPKKDDKVIEMMSEILTKIGTMNAKMDVIYGIIKPKTEKVVDSEYPEEEISPEDIPF